MVVRKMLRVLALGAVLSVCGARAAGATKPGTPRGPDESALANPFTRASLLRDWVRTSNLADLRGAHLYLDGIRDRGQLAVFYRHKAFIHTKLAADFRVERIGRGERPFGLIFASTDSRTYLALEIERQKVSLLRVAPGKPPEVLGSRAVRDEQGRWHVARVACTAGLIKVFYDDRFLYQVQVPGQPGGRVGVYTKDARAEVRGLEFSGTPTRLTRQWRLLKPAAPPKDKPKAATPK